MASNAVNVFQMQCTNIRKEENDRGLIVARKYDLRCRSIAYGRVKSEIPAEEEGCIVDKTWHACNVRCWDSGYKTGTPIETELVTIYPTEHFEGFAIVTCLLCITTKFTLLTLLDGRLRRVSRKQ